MKGAIAGENIFLSFLLATDRWPLITFFPTGHWLLTTGH